ncbi:hypothetical protein [Variovorax sp. dw_954]|uniref:hypothetical protein n=1 Tax=Variovorax sp. dw_954 TaxID=2720078 RepID=UPI001BD44274|nr:hypothetical protein [Variovorax sp. dw_954]
MRRFIRALCASLLAAAALLPMAASAQGTQVAFAGLAYAGDAASLEKRFPFSREYEKRLESTDRRADARIRAAIAEAPPRNFEVLPGLIDELKGRDQALVTSLVVNAETVSVETFGELRKLFVLVRGQALFFDFKTQTVIRSYPISFEYIDVFDRQPTHEEILSRVRSVYEGAAGKPGIFARYAEVLANASIPSQVPRYLKVTDVTVSDAVAASLPDYLKESPGVMETWAADMLSEAISTHAGVPIIPYTKGYAVGGVFPMRVSDGTVFNLKLPEPDYAISVDLTNVKKVQFGQVAAGSSFIYGTFATVKIQLPGMGTSYLNSSFKNGETKVVPATQTFVDDFPAYYDSWNALFRRVAEAMAGKDQASWLKAAASASDIDSQLLKTKEMIQLCK